MEHADWLMPWLWGLGVCYPEVHKLNVEELDTGVEFGFCQK